MRGRPDVEESTAVATVGKLALGLWLFAPSLKLAAIDLAILSPCVILNGVSRA